MKIIDRSLPFFGERAAGKKITYLILHITELASAQEWWDEAQRVKVSAHYLADVDGTITRMVSEDKRAWHAGVSYWQGETDINSCSVGIEVQNPGGVAFPPAQIEAVAELCRGIIARHNILPQNVLAHSDIAPMRKKDPGELFPWRALAAQGIGLWPEVTVADKTSADIMSLLKAWGYDPSVDEKTLVTAFQRHFQPEVFPDKAGIANPDTVYLMQSLLRKTQFLNH